MDVNDVNLKDYGLNDRNKIIGVGDHHGLVGGDPYVTGKSEDLISYKSEIISRNLGENSEATNFVNSNTFELRNLDVIDSESDGLLSENSKLLGNVESIRSLITSLQTNWQNEEGQDIQDAITALTELSAVLETQIVPVYKDYAETFKDLVSETRRLQARTINSGSPVSRGAGNNIAMPY